MKPCDCKSIADTNNLNENGIRYNDWSITVKPCSVFIENHPYVKLRIPMNMFKRFAEWYVSDQDPDKMTLPFTLDLKRGG